MTIEKNLDKYCQTAIDRGASHALVTHPSRIVTAPWVRLKCQFGCSFYSKTYCCPPHTPTPKETRQLLDSYNRAILLHLQWTKDQQSGRELQILRKRGIHGDRIVSRRFLPGIFHDRRPMHAVPTYRV